MKYFFLVSMLVVLSIMTLSCRDDRIPPGSSDGEGSLSPEPAVTATVEEADIDRIYEAMGTIRPLTESVIESQVSAQVVSVAPVPGTVVKKGQVLVELDGRRLNSQLNQAREGLAIAENNLAQTQKSISEAEATLEQAELAYNRTKTLFESGIAPSQKLEIDKAAFLQAKARLERAQEAEHAARSAIRQSKQIVQEARIALGYARILSPADGIVADRMVDPGDLAVPGKPLLVIQTSGALRLEASIREGLIRKVIVGQSYPVHIETLGESIPAVIEEIVPYADPATRTFLVKASLPMTPGIYPGMFGRLMIPVEQEKTLLIPEQAVRRVGQLEMVLVETKGDWQYVYIKTGKAFDKKIEVLSGLLGDERIGYSE